MKIRLAMAPLIAIALLTCAVQRPRDRGETRVLETRGPRPWKHDWAQGAVFYEVFVRSFYDSNGDGKGDLPGLIAKLDYLNDGNPATTQDLGVEALWLMPVFQSPSYHGYDTIDYERINPDYGTNADFERLVAEARRRGVRIILDLVMNHSGSGHPWFQESASSPVSSRRDWYVWRPTDPGWTQPWGGTGRTWHPASGFYYYGVFWGGMPDLNYRTPAVRQEMQRIAKLWLDRGADGFRLDAARYVIEDGAGAGQQDVPETHAFWKEFSAYVRSVRPEALLVGENWAETPVIATYYGSTAEVPGGDELPMNFDFPLADRILAGVSSGDAAGIATKLAEVLATYPPGAQDAPFLTNHDQVRIATRLGGDRAALGAAAAVLLTLPGSPFLYYGEEVGLGNGATPNDEAKRTPMPWDGSGNGGFTTGTPWFPFAAGRETANVAVESGDPASLLSRYRRLIRVRQSSEALRRGSIAPLPATSSPTPILAYLRTAGNERVLVAHNVSASFAFGGPYAIAASSAEALFADDAAQASGSSGAWTVTLPPRASGVWRLQ